MSQLAVQVDDLTKYYGQFCAVNHVSFSVKSGEIFGLLGANGAGKSTTIQMLLGLTETDAGSIRYFGQDFFTHRQECLGQMNFASTYAELQVRMTVEENLKVFAMLYRVKDANERIKYLLKLLEIGEYRKMLFWNLSAGQKTRVILAKSLLNRPRLLLMDEPTASLDPDIVHKVIHLIKELQRQEGLSIIFTSHNMEEVARLCDRVAFLARGEIVAVDTPLELTKKIGLAKLTLSFDGPQKVVTEYLEKHAYTYEYVRTSLVEVRLSEELIPKVLFGLKEAGVWITSITTEQPSLEDVFLHLARHQRL